MNILIVKKYGGNMIFNNLYWTRVVKNIGCLLVTLTLMYTLFKLSIFYIPFLVAFIISIMLEPVIKKIMRKTNLSRRTSSIIIFLCVTICIIGLLSWGIATVISESSNLLESLNGYIEKIYQIFTDYLKWFEEKKINISSELMDIVNGSVEDVLKTLVEWMRAKLTVLAEGITNIPRLVMQFLITIMALYFICVDKIYIIDQVEHHVPREWLKKIKLHFREITSTLGGYLSAQLVLIIVSFVIVLIGLYVLKFIGFNIEYPLIMAFVIGFVDALPILGSGTIILPWAIISALDGQINLGIALLVLLIVVSATRQILEPKLVSQNIGIHPIFTLLAMYTGFNLIGVIGMLVGPIVLIIFKNIFANLINQGVFKSIFDKN